MCRYGNAYRRACVRASCFAMDPPQLHTMVLLEHDPCATCPRREKGQAHCTELTCNQCSSDSLILLSTSNVSGVGAIAHKLTLKLKMHDRQYVMSVAHGCCEPRDVDWDEMRQYPTGNLIVRFLTLNKFCFSSKFSIKF